MTLTKSQLAREVLAFLTPGRWTKGAYHRRAMPDLGRPQDTYCLVGATHAVLHQHGLVEDHLTHQLYEELAAKFAEQQPHHAQSHHANWIRMTPGRTCVISFNDSADTQYEDVRVALEKTAAALEERGQ